MAAASLVDKIRALLASEAHERQIAAAIVLGELGAREAAVFAALASAVGGGIPPVQRHALDALARLGAGGPPSKLGAAGVAAVVSAISSCLPSRDEQVRRAAVDAAVAFGEDAVDAARARLGESADPLERRALEEILGRAGGKDAFSALLTALDTPDVEAARAAALAVRQRVREASPRERAAYLAQLTKVLGAKPGERSSAKPEAKSGKRRASPALLSGALKILGYLEDSATIPTLLAFARDKRQHEPVRQEAVVALRFAARGKAGARVPAALVEIAERAPPEVARAALYTLASLEVPAALAPRLGKLALGGEPERALLALERLAQISSPAGADALAAILTATADRARAEAAATALAARPDGAPALGRALLRVRDVERAALLARLLRPSARALAASGAAGRKLARALCADALARIARGGPGADALLPLARELDREATTTGLRSLATRLQRKDAERALAVLRLVGQAQDATADDGYALAAAELRAGRRDEALVIVGQLLDRAFDLPAALRRDRSLTPEQRYQIGFRLVERRHPAGEEVLVDLSRAGRNKIATMAKAKLKSAGYV